MTKEEIEEDEDEEEGETEDVSAAVVKEKSSHLPNKDQTKKGR